MKLLLAAAMALSSTALYAKEHKDKNWEKLTFEQQKEMKLKWLDDKAALIEKNRNCVNHAKDKSALKNCKEEMWAEKKAMKQQWKKSKKQAQEEADKD